MMIKNKIINIIYKLSRKEKSEEAREQDKIIVKLRYDDGIHWKWNCPNCNPNGLTFTYSARINRQWGVSKDKVYCVNCKTLYDFIKEEREVE